MFHLLCLRVLVWMRILLLFQQQMFLLISAIRSMTLFISSTLFCCSIVLLLISSTDEVIASTDLLIVWNVFLFLQLLESSCSCLIAASKSFSRSIQSFSEVYYHLTYTFCCLSLIPRQVFLPLGRPPQNPALLTSSAASIAALGKQVCLI